MVEVSLTVGKLDASLALLLTKDHHLIEFPTILLPNGVRAGSIVKIKCEQDLESEIEEDKQFHVIQDEILETFGKNLPQSPVLKVKNVTQTSCVLEWETLELGTANLKNLVLFKDGKKLGYIPQPLTNRTTKLSGLPIDKTFQFQLRLDTSAGVYSSESIEVTTHKMTDLSGITVCLGDVGVNEQFTVEDIEEALKNMGAHYPPQTGIKVDTTHFICTRENKNNAEYLKACEMNIPVVRPEWLKACERERRIVGVRDFYVKDCVLPDIFAKNYWKKESDPKPQTESEPISDAASKPQETQNTNGAEPPTENGEQKKDETEGSDPNKSITEQENTESDPKSESVPSTDNNNGGVTKDDTSAISEQTEKAADAEVVTEGDKTEVEEKTEAEAEAEPESKPEQTSSEKADPAPEYEEVELSEKADPVSTEKEASHDSPAEEIEEKSEKVDEDSNTEVEGTEVEEAQPEDKSQPKASKKKKNKKKKKN